MVTSTSFQDNRDMIGYLTYKLKNQSLSDTSIQKHNDDDHDSGTESDDEGADAEELERYMGSDRQDATGSVPSDRASSTLETITDTTTEGRTSEERQPLSCSSKTDVESPLPDTLLSDSALPSDTDLNVEHHSSEEELEVINCRSRNASGGRLVQYPEKRKWSQVNRLTVGDPTGRTSAGGSSDEEVRDLMCVSAPVEFRASPPANVPKPSRSLSPPSKVFHKAPHPSGHIPPHELCTVSPRKRHRKNLMLMQRQKELGASPSPSEQRPSLDFEKMQQVILWS